MTRAGRIPGEVAGSTRPVAADAHRQLGLETKPQSFRRHKFWRSQAAQGRKSALFDGTKRLFNGDYWPRAAARRARTDGAVGDPTPDPDHPMLRGMITINVDFTNFGQSQRAVFHIRADADKPDAPLRIFRVEHDGWSYP